MLDKEAVLPGHGSIAQLAQNVKDDVWVVSE